MPSHHPLCLLIDVSEPRASEKRSQPTLFNGSLARGTLRNELIEVPASCPGGPLRQTCSSRSAGSWWARGSRSACPAPGPTAPPYCNPPRSLHDPSSCSAVLQVCMAQDHFPGGRLARAPGARARDALGRRAFLTPQGNTAAYTAEGSPFLTHGARLNGFLLHFLLKNC